MTASIISGLVLYLGFRVILTFDNPVNPLRGITWKILFIGFLTKRLKSTYDVQKIKKEMNLE